MSVYLKEIKFLIVFLLSSISFCCLEAASVSTLDVSADKGGRYADNSLLAKGEWFKIRVRETGIYRISYKELRNMGIAKPENVRLYGYGGAALEEQLTAENYKDDLPQQPLYFALGHDGRFGEDDYILFYAQGPVSWRYDGTKGCFLHTTNPYSEYGCYFLTSSLGAGEKIMEGPDRGVGQQTITDFTAYYVYDDDLYSLSNMGKKFYSDVLSNAKPTFAHTVRMPNVVDKPAKVLIELGVGSGVAAKIDVSVNDQMVKTLSLPQTSLPSYDHAAMKEVMLDFTPRQSNILDIKLNYQNPTASLYLYYLSLNVQCKLEKTDGTPLFFRSAEHLGRSGLYDYQISNLRGNVAVWDVTDPRKVESMSLRKGQDGGVRFSATMDSLREYVVLDPVSDRFLSPEFVGRVQNQNLHSLPQADMIIISHTDFLPQAQRLAEEHLRRDGMTAHVVDAQLIYNEFSSGTPDATAYRRFMKMFFDRSTHISTAPKYLLLFGDGSFDNRRLLASRTDKDIYRLLTYQSSNSTSEVDSYCSDDYFGVLEDGSGANLAADILNVAVGRIPAYTETQAKGAVDKIIGYLNSTDCDYWRNRAIFIGDDGDGNEHMSSADAVCKNTERYYPDLLTRKLYFDAYVQETSASGESYPTLRKEFLDYINQGVLMINYSGHGGYIGWANEQLLTADDIVNMYNVRLPLWVTATCDFARFDDFKDSGGELMMLNPKGGGIALITTTRTVISSKNRMFNNELAKYILARDEAGRPYSVGEAMRLAKNRRQQSQDNNRLSFICLGDPSVSLLYPQTHRVVLDSVNHKAVADVDTVGALDLVRITGSVVAADNMVDNDFNGFVHITLFDKQETLSTLSNEGNVPFVYTARPNTIFSGKAQVRGGKFETEFLLPLDIKYNYGEGKFFFYAADIERNIDANGSSEAIVIGGENPDMKLENDGPEVEMYINTPSFRDGQIVNENPLFVANVSDDSGINTIGSGIGHDIVLRLNDNTKYEYILNNYYESLFGSYKRGQVVFPLSGLPDGDYSLLFRVWDLQNNSTTRELRFLVSQGAPVSALKSMVYPNPAREDADFVIYHDRPLQPLQLKVYIYNLMGQMVYSDMQSIVSDSSGEIHYPCDFSGEVCLEEGLYLVRAVLTDKNGKHDHTAAKVIIRK